MVRRVLAIAVMLTLIAWSAVPSQASVPSLPQNTVLGEQALALINTPCLVAQTSPSALATATPGAGGAGASPTPSSPTSSASSSASTASGASPSPSASGSPQNGAGAEPAVIGTPTPSPSPSPSPSPTNPPPFIPQGPGVLVPPPLPSTSPAITPPPLPTPTPSTVPVSPPPVYLSPVTPAPSASPIPIITAGPIRSGVKASPTPVPSPGETLGPNDYAILGDTLTGNRTPGQPFDLDGHVNILYSDGVLIGDHAHYDGTRYIDITGHTFLQNRIGDTTLAADSIRFDTATQHAILINGRGVTTEGVDRGRLHFNAQEMVTERNGVSHGTHASFTTCENPHGGYHIESKTLDIYPGDRAIARHAVLFLGPLAIFYLPLLIIPLKRGDNGPARRRQFIPLIGYSEAEGFYVKAQIGFGTSPWYYGYYRLEYYTKIGYGLGYVGSIRTKNGKRSLDLDFFRLHNRTDGSDNWNIDLNDQETISKVFRATARFSYQADYGPLINLPANISIALGLSKTQPKDVQNFSFSRQSTGSEISTNNYGFSDVHTFDTRLSNQFTASETTNSNSYLGYTSNQSTLHFNDDLHLSESTVDYDLTVDKYDSTTPSNVNKLPELLVRPHNLLVPGLKYIPITGTFTIGEYNDPIAELTSQRAEFQVNIGPGVADTPIGQFNASVNIRQDFYGTGDAHAQIVEQATLNSPLGNHAFNTLSYSEQHINGLGDEPFTFDAIGGAYQNLQDIFKLYSNETYALVLQSGTAFNHMAQPIQYQLLTRPSARSSLLIGGAWTPGSGFGFDRTSVQIGTPIGRASDIQFATFVDWKNKGRLESKQVYLRQVIGDCYEVRVAYNQDLKTVNVTLDILAFPSQALNFGLGQQTAIIPQSFATSQFFTGQ